MPIPARALAESFDHRLQQIELRQLVTRALQEEHRYLHFRQVVGPGRGGFCCREGEEDKAVNIGQGIERLRLGCHSAAKRSSAREQW